MTPVIVVGSGPSGVHFARTLLDMGQRVLMLDVGREGPAPVRPELNLEQLKAELADPVAYFLGESFEGITYPDADAEYYGVPPGRAHVFSRSTGFTSRSSGFAPLFSFARGGLAEAWTGGVYPFSPDEIVDFPFSFGDLAPAYAEVARRIGVSGEHDDLARFMPMHEHIMPPLELDAHSQAVLDRYARVRTRLNDQLGCWVGRSRLATLTRDHNGRHGCRYLGRCLWGCPVHALYTPSLTLADCMTHPHFNYVPDVQVTHFEFRGNRVLAVVGRSADGRVVRFEADTLALAAGALGSSRIFLESIYRATGEIVQLRGLMDNPQVLVPFLNLDMIGRAYQPVNYQYHMLGLGLACADPRHYVHGQITTLKTTMAHPIIQSLPFDLRAATAAFRRLRPALGLVNVNFHDERRDTCLLTLERTPAGPGLAVEYAPQKDAKLHIDRALARVRAALRRLNCFAPPSMMHVRPAGASVHYAGTLPMMAVGGSLTATPECRSRDFQNLLLVDGSTFPFLPAKNITFTLMANAVRVAWANFS